MKKLQTEICVLGGGPAGSATARRLAMLGHSVALIEKAEFPRTHIGESLTGGIVPLLDVLELRQQIEQESFLRTKAAIVRWNEGTQYRELSGASGFQVDRARFDHLLLQSACRAGVRILQPARATDIRNNCDQGWKLAIEVANRNIVDIESLFLVDATGRNSIMGGARTRNGAPTLALYAYWQEAAIEGPETRVEAGESEWFWGAPLPQGEFNATVFIDPARFARGVAAAGSLHSFYRGLIQQSRLICGCLQGTRVTNVRVCDATCTSAKLPVTSNSIKVGEAAFSIDPLSSQGVQTSVGSALHAAAVIHTILERPGHAALARQFYFDRQRQSVAFHKNAAAGFYAGAARVYQTEFWKRRSIIEGPSGSKAEPEPFPVPTSESQVRVAPGISFCIIPVIENEFVVPANAIVVPDVVSPIVFLEGIQVAALVEMIDAPMTCQEIIRRWTTRGSVSSRQAIEILRRAMELRILANAQTAGAPVPPHGG